MLLKKGSKGDDVKKLQIFLGITADGAFGSKTETAVKTYQATHGLVSDGVVGDKTWNKMFNSEKLDCDIIYNPISVHIKSVKNPRQIKYIVVHYTAGVTSKEGSANNNRKVFLNKSASADYCVDDKVIMQINPDPLKYYCLAVGNGNSKKGIYNKDCINVEICSSLKNGNPAFANHEGWYFTDAVIENSIKLIKYLMKTYNIPLDRVIRHYDVTGKNCPGILGWNDGALYEISGKITKSKNNSLKWNDFKTKLV